MRFINLVFLLHCCSEALSSSEESNIHIVPKSRERDDVCLTPECINTASQILKNMDHNVKPCDDFHKFACGGFLNTTIIPSGKTDVNMFSIVEDIVVEQLRSSIEEESHPNELKTFRLAKDFYKACMNTTAIEEKGLQPFLDNLRRLGGWPVLDGEQWNKDNFTWEDFVYRSRKLGYSINNFIKFTVNIDRQNTSRHIIILTQATLGLPLGHLLNGFDNNIVQAYYKYMVDIAVILGANPDRASIELKESLEFEIQLAKISLSYKQRQNVTLLYNLMTVNDLSVAYPSIPWWEYLSTILASQAQLNRDDIIIVKTPSYLRDFERLIANTPKRVQANYAFWRATVASVGYLTDEIRKRQLEYTAGFDGKIEREPRWMECVKIASDILAISVSAMYVRKYFKEDAKKAAHEMVGDIKLEFTKILRKVEWMDERTRANALDKAAYMTSHIAYPNELLDDRKLEEFYDGLEISSNDYLGSLMNLTIFRTNLSFSRLRKPVNKTEWITHAESNVVNAFYIKLENSIQFPAGILQGIFFNNDRPRYMNYGSIGFIIGHEITHAFDTKGRQYDKDGNYVDWWNSKTKDHFLKRAECIIHEYGNYTVKEIEMNLNGIRTQGENIADNGGIKVAYYAYKEWAKRNKPEQTLPNLPYNAEQMFWISAANIWCIKYRPEVMKYLIILDHHSPGEFRVRGPLSNMEEFSRDFNCPVGSRMNPTKKCVVW